MVDLLARAIPSLERVARLAREDTYVVMRPCRNGKFDLVVWTFFSKTDLRVVVETAPSITADAITWIMFLLMMPPIMPEAQIFLCLRRSS